MEIDPQAKLAELAEIDQELNDLITLAQKALEKRKEAVKKELQDYVKANGEISGSGYKVTASIRDTYPTEALNLYANSHPDLLAIRKSTLVATVSKI